MKSRQVSRFGRAFRSLMLAIVCAAAGAWSGTSGAVEILAGPMPAEVIRVIDGDTLVVRVRIWLGQEVETAVRVAGIDAPEIRGRCAQERLLADRSRIFLEREVASAPISLVDIRRGKFAGRILASVRTEQGTDLGAALVAAGLARDYEGRGARPNWCARPIAAAGAG